jgi:hypothetical protein
MPCGLSSSPTPIRTYMEVAHAEIGSMINTDALLSHEGNLNGVSDSSATTTMTRRCENTAKELLEARLPLCFAYQNLIPENK